MVCVTGLCIPVGLQRSADGVRKNHISGNGDTAPARLLVSLGLRERCISSVHEQFTDVVCSPLGYELSMCDSHRHDYVHLVECEATISLDEGCQTFCMFMGIIQTRAYKPDDEFVAAESYDDLA